MCLGVRHIGCTANLVVDLTELVNQVAQFQSGTACRVVKICAV
jgi:hypothetical protein